MTSSSAAFGARPLRNVYGVSAAVSHGCTAFGCPVGPSTAPREPSSAAGTVTSPIAWRTPATAARRGTSDDETRARSKSGMLSSASVPALTVSFWSPATTIGAAE